MQKQNIRPSMIFIVCCTLSKVKLKFPAHHWKCKLSLKIAPEYLARRSNTILTLRGLLQNIAKGTTIQEKTRKSTSNSTSTLHQPQHQNQPKSLKGQFKPFHAFSPINTKITFVKIDERVVVRECCDLSSPLAAEVPSDWGEEGTQRSHQVTPSKRGIQRSKDKSHPNGALPMPPLTKLMQKLWFLRIRLSLRPKS